MKKNNYLTRYIRARLLKKNQNMLICICGPTGTGKSYSAIKLGELIDPTFTAERVVFHPEKFMSLLNYGDSKGKLKKGNVVVFDEAGVNIASRTWYSISNKIVNYVLQTFRHRNLCVIFTVPDFAFIDSQTRRLFHALFETCSIDYNAKQVKLKPLMIQNNVRRGKLYYKYLRVKGDDDGMVCLRRINLGMPLVSNRDPYEIRKKKFTTNLNKDIGGEIKVKVKKKEWKCLVCGYKWFSNKNEIPKRCARRSCQSTQWKKGRNHEEKRWVKGGYGEILRHVSAFPNLKLGVKKENVKNIV